MLFFIGFGIFVSAVFLIEGIYYTHKSLLGAEARRMRRRLRNVSASSYDYATVDILRKDVMSEIPWLNQLFLKIAPLRHLSRLLKQANIQRPLSIFILLPPLLLFLGFWAGRFLAQGFLVSLLAGVGTGILPFIYIHFKRQKRMRRFQTQLPEAMELIARSLKAGHAFSGGLKMVADEFDDPVGTEFNKSLHESNFGMGLTEVLKNLSNRIDCADLKYFVVATIIQEKTGGNLAEILENSSYLIRERFKLQGTIRVLSAEGRFSAIILIALPILLAFAIYLINPSYIRPLVTNNLGRKMLFFASFMMISGVLLIRKMVKIKV